jgi:uncharacterized protein with NAD-binding domain and iron-sulfur cluster
MRERVVILGGGIGGLSSAQELVERGFEVEIFERKSIPGGKARSIDADHPVPFGGARAGGAGRKGRGLPGEHGFRFFPGFYKHVVDTMRRIPYGNRTVADNLVDTTRVHLAYFDQPEVLLPARFPQSPADLQQAVTSVLELIGGRNDIASPDTAFFGQKVWQVLTSCEERRLGEYERIDWWTFIDAARRSPAYQKVYGHAITRSLVAAKADRASTKTIGDIFVQMILSILQPGEAADRLLCGPTNDVWIDPWVSHLQNLGATYHLGCEVRSINCRGGRIRSATIVQDGRTFEVEADHFISAVPVERMTELLDRDLLSAAPGLGTLPELSRYVEWMNGIQFYLNEDVPVAHGHSICMDSPWALTSVSQKQFWPEFDLSRCGDGNVRGILSVDISDFFAKGLNGKIGAECSPQEIALEVWEQLKRSFNGGGRTVLRDSQLVSWFLDPDLTADPAQPGRLTNMEPLLVNYVDTWRLRPDAVTEIPNLFLASDYVRTYTDLATMEAANEAGRRAVNGVIAASRMAATPCRLWNLHEPEAFAPWRTYDRLRYRQGIGWDGSLAAIGSAAFSLMGQAGGLLGGGAALPGAFPRIAPAPAMPPRPRPGRVRIVREARS